MSLFVTAVREEPTLPPVKEVIIRLSPGYADSLLRDLHQLVPGKQFDGGPITRIVRTLRTQLTEALGEQA